MTMPDEDVLHRLLSSLGECAGQIDRTFSVAGERLGEGLAVFQSLKDGLVSLSRELDGEDFQAACSALAGLAADLEALSDDLPRETGTLSSIGAESRLAAASMERLLGSMRLICTLARSARIEAASVTDRAEEFGEFADEITELALRSQRTVEVCVREHNALTALLSTALASRRSFMMRFGPTLSRLATGLRRTLAAVAERQRQGVGLTRRAAENSGRIAVAAGGAIMSLQAGDAIRQRLEHSLVALRPMIDRSDWGLELPATLSPTGEKTLATALFSLQERQLDATAKALRRDVMDIDRTLLALAEDTGPLADLGRSLYGGDDPRSASFLQNLASDLAQAAEILGECQAARQDVARVTKALTRSLNALDETVSALETTVASIRLIGTNASLRAARLGQGGRSLVVIAQEMKTAATDVTRDAERIKPVFASMQSAASGLDRGERSLEEVDPLDVTMERSLAAIGASAARLGDTLTRLTKASVEFEAVIGHARLMFSNAAMTADAIQSGAAILAWSSDEPFAPHADDVDAIGVLFATVIRPTYTMAAEREIHDAVMAALSLARPNVTSETSESRSEGADDDFLF